MKQRKIEKLMARHRALENQLEGLERFLHSTTSSLNDAEAKCLEKEVALLFNDLSKTAKRLRKAWKVERAAMQSA